MKKISTVTAKKVEKVVSQKLTIGLDLGDRWSWYCVLDETGEVVLEQKVATTPKAMKEVFGGMARSRMALETGTHSPWVSRVLSELGHEVIVAHARNVRLIGESRKKDDRLDARTLARLVRIDPQLLAPVKHRSAQAQADLMAIRARAGLVRTRTSLINTARGVTKSYGERLRGCNPQFLPLRARFAIQRTISHLASNSAVALSDHAKSRAPHKTPALPDYGPQISVRPLPRAYGRTERSSGKCACRFWLCNDRTLPCILQVLS
jgi:Transposase